MIRKYYEGIIEQTYDKVGRFTQNITMARYSNDFSIEEIRLPESVKGRDNVFLWEYEFDPDNMSGPYEPFLDMICTMFKKYATVSVDEFLEKNDIYYLHRPTIRAYMESGRCYRQEQLILDETQYEQERMTDGILRMLISLSEVMPCVIVLNRLQLAAKSTIVLINRLLDMKDVKNIGLILGVNDLVHIPDHVLSVWDKMMEKLRDRSQVFHIGTSGKVQKNQRLYASITQNDVALQQITNLVNMLDFAQARFYLDELDRRIKFENLELDDDFRFKLSIQYAFAEIFSRDLSKALEICEEIKKLQLSISTNRKMFYYYYLTSIVFMYQGRLLDSIKYAKTSQEYAKKAENGKWEFLAELLEVQAKMSGWCNIFFCAQDIEIREELLEKLTYYNYKNHLAYTYVYAYDNTPEIVARAYHSEAELVYFSKGVALAKEIGNEKLIYNSYQKNIMLASANGMYEISILYSVRTFEAIKDKCSLEGGRIYSGLGYNLSALGKTKEAMLYFKKAIQIFCELKLPEDIAEVFYNMSLNCIQMEEYKEAAEYLSLCMKTIEKLQLNSLRVCNISKLYAIWALCSIMMGDNFNCERYLLNCRQFLNYVIEKEDKDEIGSIHDYAKCDDDMFLYHFSSAILNMLREDEDSTLKEFETAEYHLRYAEGNQFFCYRLFRESRIQFFQSIGRLDLRDRERENLEEYEKNRKKIDLEEGLKILDHVKLKESEVEKIPMAEIDELIQQEAIYRAYQLTKRQMDFISVWQKLIDVTDVSAETMMESVMKTFLYHFTVDRALYIRYQEDEPEILFDNTEREITVEKQKFIAKCFEEDPRGFVVSKISSNYSEHLNIISLFGEDNVCSMVAIPFMNNGKPQSVLITYVLMKDNWHSSVNRYMLDENDLNIYELLFREIQYSLNRLDAYEKVYEMNTKLYQAAITDQLTGIYNRKGFYMRIEEIMKKLQRKNQKSSFALMFIDLDNFKGYNDTFGHDVGDLILKEMAEIFREVCGKEGFVSRYGGDEFIIFVQNNEKSVLEEMAKTIYKKIGEKNGFKAEIERDLQREIVLQENKKISCSIGIAGSDEVQSEEDINRLIKQADDLLYQIKTTSKGRYTFM